jgi:hypothetical protein
MVQWLCDEQDEDHAAAVMFNIMEAEYVRTKTPENPPKILEPNTDEAGTSPIWDANDIC